MRLVSKRLAAALVVFGASIALAGADEQTGAPVPRTALTTLPIREITVFKHGYAFVPHEGVLPTNADGDGILDPLPMPVIGPFWPYSSDATAKLSGVVVGRKWVGVVYLPRGIRWIPSYQIDIDGAGHARVKLQPTLLNELADFESVTAHLIIGVPTAAARIRTGGRGTSGRTGGATSTVSGG